jgi:hypothetical protein
MLTNLHTQDRRIKVTAIITVCFTLLAVPISAMDPSGDTTTVAKVLFIFIVGVLGCFWFNAWALKSSTLEAIDLLTEGKRVKHVELNPHNQNIVVLEIDTSTPILVGGKTFLDSDYIILRALAGELQKRGLITLPSSPTPVVTKLHIDF